MNFQCLVLPKAKRELRSLYDWIERRSPVGAARWYNEFTRALLRLEDDPLAFPVAPETDVAEQEVRELLFKTRRGKRYRVLFHVNLKADVVFVLHVLGPGHPDLTAEDFE